MSHDITALRSALFAQLEELRAADTTNPEALKAAIRKAGAVSDLAKTLTETARVDVDYLRASGGGESTFLDSTVGARNLPPGITGITRHRLAG